MSTASEFRVEKVDRPAADAVVYRLRGVMGEAHGCYEFMERFKESLAEAPPRIVIDLGGLENMYSAGVGIIAACFTGAREEGRTVLLCAVPPLVLRTLKITGILPEVEAYEDEQAALAAPID